ncbi:MAG TPA: BspA family leucine-rich repeat surface protein [Turneriella sp.]|nr:BspA family leucine-rich repeat surface protein [Turneriella sp.]
MKTMVRQARQSKTLILILVMAILGCDGYGQYFVEDEPTTNPPTSSEPIQPVFISKWDTTQTGASASNQIRLPLNASGSYNFTVDWGDGSANSIASAGDPAKVHTYASGGIYTIKITGQIDGFGFANSGEDNKKLLDISQWGQVKLHNSGYVFYGITLVSFSASDSPDLSNVTNMDSMFYNASAFNQDLSAWGDAGGGALCTNIATKPTNFNSGAGTITLPCGWQP